MVPGRTPAPPATANATLRLLSGAATNPYLFGYSLDSFGDSLNLSFSDTGGVAMARAMHLGVLRYPGGTGSNIWDLRKGRYVAPMPFPAPDGYYNFQQHFQPWINPLPEGTFSAASFLAGLGREARRVIWDLNVYSNNASQTCNDIAYIASLPGQRETPGVMLELGNEFYLRNQGLPRFPDADAYGAAMAPVVACARRLMPNALVGAVGGGSDWNRALRPHLHLFDAVTFHTYAPTGRDVDNAAGSTEGRAGFLAAFGRAYYQRQVAQLLDELGAAVPLWETEFNVGLVSDPAGCALPDYIFGGLHGAFHAARIIAAINSPTGSIGAITLEEFSAYGPGLPYLHPPRTDYFCGLAPLRAYPTKPNEPSAAGVSGLGQLVSHLAARALYNGNGATQMHGVEVAGGPSLPFEMFGAAQPCLQAAAFSAAARRGPQLSLALLNVCNLTARARLHNYTAGTATLYHLLDPGGWSRLPADPDTFPWPDGPLRPARGQVEPATVGEQPAVTLAAPPLTFAVWELK